MQEQPCATPTGADRQPCGRPARLYPGGWRCDEHTPARLAGRPEPLSTPMHPHPAG